MDLHPYYNQILAKKNIFNFAYIFILLPQVLYIPDFYPHIAKGVSEFQLFGVKKLRCAMKWSQKL
ncbi:MAG TPA: hypothetical protein DCX32_01680 [Candidatus Moranbacteria bacterium]|nr:MAG: hypothetical protein UW87_C0022G0009 [Candidatus Moranbacteria bacterium GW2011_GWC2_45_10]KKT93822.1 MAG: hypothetical protein UW95_C0020G0017 [Parcubacteria group bacterium GW2011_GWC1_45_14]HAV11232.1 hypothetical protein [Candidatus Moranbacteria bacterium]